MEKVLLANWVASQISLRNLITQVPTVSVYLLCQLS
jgi:hypothetical protein